MERYHHNKRYQSKALRFIYIRKSQRRHDSQSETAIVTTNDSDWLSHLRCDLRFACCVLCS